MPQLNFSVKNNNNEKNQSFRPTQQRRIIRSFKVDPNHCMWPILMEYYVVNVQC